MGRDLGESVERDVLEQTAAAGTKTAHKPFVIKQTLLHSLCFIPPAPWQVSGPLRFCWILFSAYQLLNLWTWHFNTVWRWSGKLITPSGEIQRLIFWVSFFSASQRSFFFFSKETHLFRAVIQHRKWDRSSLQTYRTEKEIKWNRTDSFFFFFKHSLSSTFNRAWRAWEVGQCSLLCMQPNEL